MTKSKVLHLANQNICQQQYEPIRIRNQKRVAGAKRGKTGALYKTTIYLVLLQFCRNKLDYFTQLRSSRKARTNVIMWLLAILSAPPYALLYLSEFPLSKNIPDFFPQTSFAFSWLVRSFKDSHQQRGQLSSLASDTYVKQDTPEYNHDVPCVQCLVKFNNFISLKTWLQ